MSSPLNPYGQFALDLDGPSFLEARDLFAPVASTTAVTSSDLSGCFRLEQQLPGGISSSHWSNAPFPWRTKDSGQKSRRRLYSCQCNL